MQCVIGGVACHSGPDVMEAVQGYSKAEKIHKHFRYR